MKFAIASDHGGFALKAVLREHLAEQGHEVLDLGPEAAARCDYPDFAAKVARAVSNGTVDLGLLVCGSGIGMSMAANKVAGIRAAVVQDVGHAVLAREHNNANVLCLGERFTAPALARSIVDAWLGADFGGGRHVGRVAKIHGLE